MTKCKAILFDLGGVILNIDYKLTSLAFKTLGVNNFDELYTQKNQIPIFDQFETGKCSPKEFLQQLNKIINKNILEADLINAWNAMLLDLPTIRLNYLNTLKKDYRVYLLSNTNEIHISAFEKTLNKAGQINSFQDCFNNIYYSCRMGLRKPNKDCFMKVLEEVYSKPEEMLFIDDSIQHIEGAKSCGIQAHLLPKDQCITTFVPDIIQSKPH